MSKTRSIRGFVPLALFIAAGGIAPKAIADPAEQLPTVNVTSFEAAAHASPAAPNPPPIVQKYDLPQKSDDITSEELEETINVIDPEDAVKYMPGLFVRKRNDGDNQAVLATRTWGLNSSARTLIYADDILISALINNNNQNGAPHWNLVAPESIARVDFLEGPYSAAYSGNSIGGVLLITTKMPDKFTFNFKQTEAIQTFDQYDTHGIYPTHQTSASIGDRFGIFSYFLSANYQDAYDQPLTYTTNSTLPAGTSGGFVALNKTGQPADVVGTGAMLHTQQLATNLKMALDFLPWLRGTYTFGFWSNDEQSTPTTYLTSAATGDPTFGGISSFANSRYSWQEQHVANAISLASNTKGPLDFDLALSSYNYLNDIQRNPFTVTSAGVGFSEFGKIARMDGTNWQNVDLKGVWRPFGFNGVDEVSFGLHGDRYDLNNPTYQTPTWNYGSDDGSGALYSDGQGTTQTGALWAQNVWHIIPTVKLTFGGRLESWGAMNGFNLATTANSKTGAINTTTTVSQPDLHSVNFSPKASLSWNPNKDWGITGSFGESYRYPTVGELYQTVTSGTNILIPNPDLSPEQDFSGEVDIERYWTDGKVRLSLFQENTNEAIISQTNFVNSQAGGQLPVTSVSNIGSIRNRGVELAAQKDNVGIRGVELFGSITYVDSRILSDPGWAGTYPGTSIPDQVVGKRVPYVPDWRTTSGITYRPDDHWAFTLAARYEGKMYSTLDNTDVVSNVFGAFDRFFVVDTRIHYKATDNVYLDVGVDNLNNDKYFLYHPFPGRTFVADGRIVF